MGERSQISISHNQLDIKRTGANFFFFFFGWYITPKDIEKAQLTKENAGNVKT